MKQLPKFEWIDGMSYFSIEEVTNEREQYNNSIFKMTYQDGTEDSEKQSIVFHTADIHDIAEVINKFVNYYSNNKCWDCCTMCFAENGCKDDCEIIQSYREE